MQGENRNEVDFMEFALTEARTAQTKGEVPVGCVFVYQNKIIASGGNFVNATKNAIRHAEFECIDKTLEYCSKNYLNVQEVFSEIAVYVTVEPCIMCSAALNNFRVKKIVYGCPNDRFGGSTVLDVASILNYNNISITGGVRAEEAMDLLKEFYKGENPAAPIPKVKKIKD